MARKKPRTEDVPVTASETKFVRLELPRETHRILRIEAAKQEVSMAHLARIAIDEYLARRISRKQ